MRVLIVRLTSMGDLVQTLPALTDASRAFPQIRFDWAVDESFAQIPAWHSHVEQVLAAPLRRWGKSPGPAMRSGELGPFLKQLRARQYDFVVDLQGEWKSAMISRLAHGRLRGYAGQSVHEWGAHLAYSKRFPVPKGQHSIQRMRQLLSKALSYSYSEQSIEYGVDRSRLPKTEIEFSGSYLVFVHSTAWQSKVWPEHYWRQLTLLANTAGYQVVLPWGNDAERERAVRIAEGANAFALPPMSIAEKATIISGADGTVGLDTGLSHIAAALDIPSVTLYGATDPLLVGATGRNQVQLASTFECVKCHDVTCNYAKPAEFKPACFVEVRPEFVWDELTKLVR